MTTLPVPGVVTTGPAHASAIDDAARPGRRRWRRPTSYLFVVPALVLVVGMFWYSIVVTVWLSFTNSNGLSSSQFIGLANYRALLA